MMEPEELSERECQQLRILYSLHLNPSITATWYHETISDLKRRGLVGEDDQGMPKLTEQGLALARTL
jgi:Mn-dependent DtxR family transcriptional regulator